MKQLELTLSHQDVPAIITIVVVIILVESFLEASTAHRCCDPCQRPLKAEQLKIGKNPSQ